MTRVKRHTGFTLLEVVLASVIGTFIALVAVSTLRAVSASRQMVSESTSVTDELRFAFQTMQEDMSNFYRDQNIWNTKFIGMIEEGDYGFVPTLTMWITSPMPARRGQPEGDIYEVQYTAVRTEPEKISLTRRICPIVTVSRDFEEYMETPGGMLTTIATGLIDMQIQYFDGNEWLDQWPEELDYLPEIVRVAMMTKMPGDEELENPIQKMFMVTFPRVSENLTIQLDEESENQYDIGSMDAPSQ